MQYKLNNNLAISETGLFYNPHTGELFELNASGIMIVEKMHEGCDTGQIKESIMLEFDISAEILELYLSDFFNSLAGYGLAEAYSSGTNNSG